MGSEPPLSFDGEWWLPHSPEAKICGRLVLVPSEQPRLELMGTLRAEKIEDELCPKVILGFTLGAKHITLWHNRLADSGYSESSWPSQELVRRQVYESRLCLEGAHSDNPDATLAESLTFKWTQAENWARHYDDPENLGRFSTEGPSEQFVAAASWRNPAPIEISARQTTVRLERVSTYSDNWPYQAELRREVQIRLLPANPSRLSDIYWTEMRKVLDFLGFVMGVPVSATKTWAVTRTPGTASEKPVTVKLLPACPRGPAGTDSGGSHILITYGNMKDWFGTALKRWLELEVGQRIACNSFLGIRYRPSYLEGTFLGTARAVEGFTRSTHRGEKPVSDEQFAGLKAELTSVVRSKLVAGTAGVLVNQIESSLNQPTLASRYQSVLRQTLPLMGLGEDLGQAGAWAQELAWVRNSIAHGLPRLVIEARNADRLLSLSNLLSAAFEALVLDTLGAPQESIARSLCDSGRLTTIPSLREGRCLDR